MSAFSVCLRQIAEQQMLRTEVHRRRESQVQVLREAQVGQHAHAESRIPAVVVADDRLFMGGTVLQRNHLWTYILKLNILQVHTHEDAKVHGAQVDIRLVLYLPLLGCGCQHRANQD